MKNTFLIILFLALICCSAAVRVQAAGPGTSAAGFLKLGVGARAVGMGESFTAVADDVNALYWNPAGIGRLSRQELTASHAVWFQDINYDFFGLAMPLSHASAGEMFVNGDRTSTAGGLPGVLGISATYLYLDGIERRTGNTADPDGYFGADDMQVSLSYAAPIARLAGSGHITSGVTVKVVRQQIDSVRAQAYAADFGLLAQTGIWSIGCVVQNLGTRIRFIERYYPLPLTYTAGVACRLMDGSLCLAADVSKPNDNDINYHIGTEYWVGGIVAMRAGYQQRDALSRSALVGKGLGASADNTLARLTGMMAGAGFRLFNYGVDYAFVPYGELGSTHRVTLGIKF